MTDILSTPGGKNSPPLDQIPGSRPAYSSSCRLQLHTIPSTPSQDFCGSASFSNRLNPFSRENSSIGRLGTLCRSILTVKETDIRLRWRNTTQMIWTHFSTVCYDLVHLFILFCLLWPTEPTESVMGLLVFESFFLSGALDDFQSLNLSSSRYNLPSIELA